MRIALLHYSAPPAIGGVERLIGYQRDLLRVAGDEVSIIAGSGHADHLLPAMHPAHPAVESGRHDLTAGMPVAGHPLTARLIGRLQPLLVDVDQCWVHNIFTVALNPFLTAALDHLARIETQIAWVSFSHDISALSAFWTPDGASCGLTAIPGVRHVALSSARQQELARVLGLPEGEIEVIAPPVDAAGWLDWGEETCRVVESAGLETADPVILVPAKLLPHKNLPLAVETAAVLQALGARPCILFSAAPSPHEVDRSAALAAELRKLAQALGVSGSVHLLPDLLGAPPSDRCLRELMLLADAVFLPSLEEGYGLPVREALLLRVPVLCTDIPALREAGGEAANYLAPNAGAEDAAEALLTLARTASNRARREVLHSARRYRSRIFAMRDMVSAYPAP